MHGDGEAHANNMEKWQDGRLLRHLGGSCGLRARLDRCLDGSEQQRHHLISSLGSSLEYLSIHRNTKTTSPLHRPEEVVLTAPDGLLGVSKRAAE